MTQLSLVLLMNADAAANVKNLTNKKEKCKCCVVKDFPPATVAVHLFRVSFDAVKSSVSIRPLASTDLLLASPYCYLSTLCFNSLLTCYFNSFIFSYGYR